MAAARPKRVTAKLRLAERPDGVVQFEIVTSRRLETFHRWTWVGWDPKRQEHLWEDGGAHTPDEYLREPSSFGFMFSGPERDKWRYINVSASAPIDGVMQSLVQRELDLSEESEERRLLAVLAQQDEIPVVWVNEGVEVAHPLEEDKRANFLIALETTTGVSAEEWKEELAELAWQRSASWRPGRPRPRAYKPRSAAPPAASILFFASRSGAIPRGRGAELLGLRLPLGRRYPRGSPAAYWGSSEPVRNVEVVAAELASAFSKTGVWPLLWRFDEEPDAYLGGHGDLDAIDKIDVEDVLRQRWSQTPWPSGSTDPFTDFPGLAHAERRMSPGSNPFAAPAEEPLGDAWLLLVPCNRPADAITMLGGLGGVVEAPDISAVLRSWEERFSATAYEVAPDLVKLAVAAPPASEEDALLVAAEHMAFCPPDDGGSAGALRKVAKGLITSETPTAETYRSSRERWYVGWYD
jgi:hypothetical protein